ncbi:hypothetical protein SNEBB_002014 [Seison nebaliae]|nr:hypothetical protein SNEBB_002014 [Seison nebaliae]
MNYFHIINVLLIFFILAISNTSSLETNKNYCCAVQVPKIKEVKYKYKTIYEKKHKRVKSGTKKCGFWNLKRCTTWKTIYAAKSRQINEHYTISYDGVCPSTSVKCCTGSLMSKGHCIPIDQLAGNMGQLNVLNKEGALSG